MSDKQPFKYTFGWDLCYTCNYRCPYCGVWEKRADDNLFLAPQEWKEIWDRVYNKYGSCHIFMSGGEPSTYPRFYELVKKISEKHTVEICTNLSWSVEELIPEIPVGRLKIAPTFHPTFSDFEDFFSKLLKIKDYLPDLQTYYVAYPGQIKQMSERSKRLKENGIKLIPMPLRGNQVVLNTEEEKQTIQDLTPYTGEKIEYQLQRISPKGKLCQAGQRYAVIRADGKVDRCSQYEDGGVGNFLDGNFELFEKPQPCEKEYCPIESQWIISQ
jgi:MoaA/NifB/PqqE/SkfB family radical SAM enzyme